MEKPKKQKGAADAKSAKPAANEKGEKSVHDSILDELAELGLEPAPKAADDDTTSSAAGGRNSRQSAGSKSRKGVSAAAHSPKKQQRDNKPLLPSIEKQQTAANKAANRRALGSKSRARPPLHGKGAVANADGNKKLPDISDRRRSSGSGGDAKRRLWAASESDANESDEEESEKLDNLGVFLENGEPFSTSIRQLLVLSKDIDCLVDVILMVLSVLMFLLLLLLLLLLVYQLPRMPSSRWRSSRI